MSTVTFRIPPRLWLTSNRHHTDRKHRAAIVRELHEVAGWTIRQAHLTPHTSPVRVDWTVHYPKGVRLDKGEASNAQPTTKALLDAAVSLGVLTDDGPRWVLSETFQRGPNLTIRGEHHITLTIREEPAA